MKKVIEILQEDGRVTKVVVQGKRVRKGTIAKPLRTTRLSEKSTSKMSRNISELNRKVLQYINNQ
jgi:hypothetical protein